MVTWDLNKLEEKKEEIKKLVDDFQKYKNNVTNIQDTLNDLAKIQILESEMYAKTQLKMSENSTPEISLSSIVIAGWPWPTTQVFTSFP